MTISRSDLGYEDIYADTYDPRDAMRPTDQDLAQERAWARQDEEERIRELRQIPPDPWESMPEDMDDWADWAGPYPETV